MYYYILRTNGVLEEVKTEKRWSLDDYYKTIDCDCIGYVLARLDKAVNIILDDEGKLVKKPINIKASLLFEPQYDFIVGDVILCTVNERGDDFTGFTEPRGKSLLDLIEKSREEFVKHVQ